MLTQKHLHYCRCLSPLKHEPASMSGWPHGRCPGASEGIASLVEAAFLDLNELVGTALVLRAVHGSTLQKSTRSPTFTALPGTGTRPRMVSMVEAL